MGPPFVAFAVSRQDGSDADGIHLLWTGPPQVGYSVDGFDIQRRNALRGEITCYTLTDPELQTLHQQFRVTVSPGTVAVQRSRCPEFPKGPPDEPAPGGDVERPLRCTDYRSFTAPSAPNPLIEKTGKYHVLDANGQSATTVSFRTAGPHRGLDCGFRLEIELASIAPAVELVLVSFAAPATVDGFRSDGSMVASVTMSAPAGQPDTIRLEGDIQLVVVTAKRNECLLLQLCVSRVEAVRPLAGTVDFRRMREGEHPNPIKDGGFVFAVNERGQPARVTEIVRLRDLTGLRCGSAMEIDLPPGTQEVELTVVHFGRPPRFAARTSTGVEVVAPTIGGAAERPDVVLLRGANLSTVSVVGGERALLLAVRAQLGDERVSPERPRSEDIPSRFQRPTFDMHERGVALRAAVSTGAHGCVRYDIRLRETHSFVRVTAGLDVMLAIAIRDGKAVDTRFLSAAGGSQTAIFEDRLVDEVLIYTIRAATALTICHDVRDPEMDERGWESAPFIARNIQLPIRNVNPVLGSAADEEALAKSRLLPGESFDPVRFGEVARLMNETSENAAEVSPMVEFLRTREDPADPFIEVRGWPYSLALLMEADWRRMVGFGFLDKGGGLTPGARYDYRITGRFRQRDLFERLIGFHTVPLETTLPRWFHLGPVLVQSPAPSTVDMFPAPPSGALRSAGRKGVRLIPSVFDDRSLELFFPEPVTRVVIEIEPGESSDLRFEARTTDYFLGLTGALFSGPVPRQVRAELQFPEPVDRIRFLGRGFLYGVRLPIGAGPTKPDESVPVSVVISGVFYVPTDPPEPPPFLGTVNAQQPQLPGDPQITTQEPPNHLGFHLYWLPPPASGSAVAPWPPDLAAFPPFDVNGFYLERRRVDTGDPYVPVDGEMGETRFFGNRTARRDPPQLFPGIDLAVVFPEAVEPKPPVAVLIEGEDTLRSLAKPDGPPPGSLHQYRIFSVDAIGRRSAVATLGSVVRLEKRLAPPQPVGPTTAPPPGVERPVGVSARVLQALDTRLTPADRALLDASTNAIVLEWAWTQAERDRDPFAKEFRVYFRGLPPDLVSGTLNGAATPAGSLWQMSATLDQPIPADILKGRYLLSGSGSYRVASNTAGRNITIMFEVSGLHPIVAPIAAAIEFPLPPDPDEMRPHRWPERTAVVPITAQENYQFVFRDRLTITATQSQARVWVGVSSADDQVYIADEIPAGQPNGGRPGNESSIVAAPASARYLGRPVFVVPPPLAAVPEQVTSEPANGRVAVRLNLPALLAGVPVPVGFKVKLERLSADELLNRMSARNDDRIGVSLPDGLTPSYTLANPDDHAKLLAQIRSGDGVRVEGRFIMDFLTRHLVGLETLWQPSSVANPVAFASAEEELPGKADRYIHRIRVVDQAGHVSAGGAILPQFVRVPSLASPASPSFEMPGSTSDTLIVTARVRDTFDAKWLVLFKLVADAETPQDGAVLEKPQLLRLPSRRDLYPNDGIRLRLADGSLLAPAHAVAVSTGSFDAPDRVIEVDIAAGSGKRVTVWAIAMTRDGITSRLIGPRTAFTGPPALTAPALGVTAAGSSDQASWGAVSSDAESAVERSTDGGATWERVTPWLKPAQTSVTIKAVAGPRQYRLRLRATQGRQATGAAVTPA